MEWFGRVYATLGAERWQQLDKAAQYASNGSGHQRAKQFASAMLGQIEKGELLDRILKKRHQDSIRALGLCPLDTGKKREPDILSRYQTYQEFLRTSKKFGSQRRASEKLAVEIGMENLARTAGFADPQRLQWAMEAAAIADLVEKPQVVSIEDTTVSLSITTTGTPEITITKAGKTLKAIPAKLKKNIDIEALVDRKQEYRQTSFPNATVPRTSNGARRCLHQTRTPTTRPAPRSRPDAAPTRPHRHHWQRDRLPRTQRHRTSLAPRQSPDYRRKIPHRPPPRPPNSLKNGISGNKNVSPPPASSPSNKSSANFMSQLPPNKPRQGSKRYEGHQVNPRQAIALFGQRGWISSPDEGLRRTFHQAGLIALVSFANGYYTPLEVEGLTIDRLNFYQRDDWKPLPLADIPPRIFSEVMRDSRSRRQRRPHRRSRSRSQCLNRRNAIEHPPRNLSPDETK